MQEKKIIIIGAGISGLYAAYKIKMLYPKSNITILEQKWIGGRIGSQFFQGTEVVTGAGVGRKRKDKLLIKLLKELEIPYQEFLSKHYYSNTLVGLCNVKETFMKLRKRYTPCKKTFKEYAESILGIEKYKIFVTCSGYSDYEKEDAYDVLYNYGFNDNYDNWTALSIPWTKLLIALINKINIKNIHLRSEVQKIDRISDNIFFVYTNKQLYTCNMIIVATPIDTIRKLLPKENIYKGIKGQPFLRLYGKFSECSIPIIKEYVKGYTIVPQPLQKIIPMDPDNGVYMIAYNDNKSSK
jgi:L-2-hydroxyglutarate oxidase LhgO